MNESINCLGFASTVDSLFSRTTAYINGFSGIIPRIKSVILLYCNLPNFLRGMNSINLIVYGDRTGGTCDFYRMGHDSSFGVLVWNNETPYLYLHFGVLRKSRTVIYCRFGHFSREIH